MNFGDSSNSRLWPDPGWFTINQSRIKSAEVFQLVMAVRSRRILLSVAFILPAALCIGGVTNSRAQRGLVIPSDGWQVNQFADGTNVPDFVGAADSFGVTGPTALAFDSKGRLFAADYKGNILILLDNNDAGVVDQVKTFAAGAPHTVPLGLEFRSNGDLFVTSTLYDPTVGPIGRILRLRDPGGVDMATDSAILIDNLPNDYSGEPTGRVKFGPDGLLYFGQGSATDDGTPMPGHHPEGPLTATILRFDVDNPPSLDALQLSGVFARGLRNPFGLAFHPTNNALFTTQIGSGEICQLNCPPVDNSPADGIEWVRQMDNKPLFYGFPGCEGVPDPANPVCAGVPQPLISYLPHLTPTSIAFYTGPQAAASNATNQMLVTIFKHLYAQAGDLKRYTLSGDPTTGFTATEVLPHIVDFGLIDPGDGPVDTAIDPITGDIYVARLDGVFHPASPNEHHHVIYRIHQIGSDSIPFIGLLNPTMIKTGTAGQTISVRARHMSPGAVVLADGVQMTTRVVGTTYPLEFDADLPASILTTEHNINIQVRNSNGTLSNIQQIQVKGKIDHPPPPGPPVLTSLTVLKNNSKVIHQVTVGMRAKKLSLVADGSNFDSGAQLLVGATPLNLTASSGTELKAGFTKAMLAAPATLQIQVKNSDGQLSGILNLVITR
jgi:glucose/arabinose dehydrogenase